MKKLSKDQIFDIVRKEKSYSSTLEEQAIDILFYANDESDIEQLANDYLIYESDQWEVVKEYSSPREPRSFDDCIDDFIEDLKDIFNENC